MQRAVIALEGHIIDSLALPKVWDTIMDMGGNFDVEEFRVGKRKDEKSYARISVEAPDEALLGEILSATGVIPQPSANAAGVPKIFLLPLAKLKRQPEPPGAQSASGTTAPVSAPARRSTKSPKERSQPASAREDECVA